MRAKIFLELIGSDFLPLVLVKLKKQGDISYHIVLCAQDFLFLFFLGKELQLQILNMMAIYQKSEIN